MNPRDLLLRAAQKIARAVNFLSGSYSLSKGLYLPKSILRIDKLSLKVDSHLFNVLFSSQYRWSLSVFNDSKLSGSMTFSKKRGIFFSGCSLLRGNVTLCFIANSTMMRCFLWEVLFGFSKYRIKPLSLKNICNIRQVSFKSSYLAFTRITFSFNSLTLWLEYQYIIQILTFTRQSTHENREVLRNNFLILITLRKQLTNHTPAQHLFHT